MERNPTLKYINTFVKQELEYDREMENILLLAMSTQTEKSVSCGGSVQGKLPNISRNYEAAFDRIRNNYFAENSTYSNLHFNRRFRMDKRLFL